MRWLILLLFPIIGSAAIHSGPAPSTTAQLPPIADGTLLGNTSGSTAAPSAIATGLTKVFDVRAYGAKCDGTTDDHAAWQGAINAAAAVSAVVSGAPLAAKIVGCSQGPSLITTTLNFTGFTSFGNPGALGLVVDMTGTCLIGKTNGAPVIDALGARYINWEHLCIYGNSTNAPNIGIQIGRATSASADDHYFHRPVIYGTFTFASFYNEASETVTVVEPFFNNASASGTPYALVLDGYNHFNATSAFVTVTEPVDTAESFNENIFIGGSITTVTPGIPIWMGNVNRHRFFGGYISTTGTYGAVLYSAATGGVTGLHMDDHFETSSLTNIFLISGSNATPSFTDLTYIEHQAQESASVFKLDTGVTSATLASATIKWDFGSSTAKVFDTASNYTLSGDVSVPGSSNWTAPTTFSGRICIGTVCSIALGTGTLNAFGGTFNQPLTVKDGNGSGALFVGADVNANTLTANTRKLARILIPTYDNVSAGTLLISADNDGTNNTVHIGGTNGTTAVTAATSIDFVTASALNTTGGTVAASFNGAGMFNSARGISTGGTKFTAAGTGCTVGTTTGGATGGTFALAAGPCTSVAITMAGATGATAPNGWTCQAHDRTAPTVLIGGESSSTTTTATITIPAGAGATDVISFSCTGY